ncbi:phosphatase PAP2 family protein [bacterium]|nr:phosphatase PAP2 family protein [bacterium]
MFLTQNNRLRVAWIAIGAALVAILTYVGVAGFDIPVQQFWRGFDGWFWHVLSAIFDDKVWAIVFCVLVGVVYIKNTISTNNYPWRFIKWFKIKALLVDFWQKTKGSYAFFIFCSIFLAGAIVQVAKVLIGRARPVLFENVGTYGFYPPSFEWAYNSMPSGHTAISFAALVMIGMLAPRWRVVTWSVAVLIGVARVCAGAHWPSDVLLGAFIGMVVADVVKFVLTRSRNA